MDREEQLRRQWHETGYEDLGIGFRPSPVEKAERIYTEAMLKRWDRFNVTALVILAAWAISLLIW